MQGRTHKKEYRAGDISCVLFTPDLELQELYQNQNNINSVGIDIYIPEDIEIPASVRGFELDLEITCQIREYYQQHHPYGDVYIPTPGIRKLSYYLYPKSNIAKIPIRMSIAPQIIEGQSCKTIIVYVDNLSSETISISKGDCLFQLCLPSLHRPDDLAIVKSLEELIHLEPKFSDPRNRDWRSIRGSRD